MLHQFNPVFIKSIPFSNNGQALYRDSLQKGLGLRVGKASKVYFVESRINNKTVRVTMGRDTLYSLEQARAEANRLLAVMANGMNPNAIDRSRSVKRISLFEVHRTYLAERNDLKPSTAYHYNRLMEKYFADWADAAILSLSQNVVELRYRELALKSLSQANLAMRYISTLFSFAMDRHAAGQKSVGLNPVKQIFCKAVHSIPHKIQASLHAGNLPAWLRAVHSLSGHAIAGDTNAVNSSTIKPSAASCDAIKDCLLLLLFTGLKRQDGLALRWNQVDLALRLIKIPVSDDNTYYELPLSTFVYYLLKKRFDKRDATSPYVFPDTDKTGHLMDYADSYKMSIQAVILSSGIRFTLASLRKVFRSIAQSLDISGAITQQIIHPKPSSTDLPSSLENREQLRDAMEAISTHLMHLTPKD